MNIQSLAVQSTLFQKEATLNASSKQQKVGKAYLKFQLDQLTPAVLSMPHVQEAIVVPARRITLMPNMPACVLGLLHQRGQVLWTINLPQMLNLQTLNLDVSHYNIIIVRVGNIPLGLVVQEVKGVMRSPSNAIQSPVGVVAPTLVPYLQGCILQPQEVLLVLDAEAIVHSPILRSNEPFR